MAEIKNAAAGEQFSSRWGLLCTILGMAVGTGNIWRFPREVVGNDGGAFILMVFITLFIWAVPLICAESVFGKNLAWQTLEPSKSCLAESGPG